MGPGAGRAAPRAAAPGAATLFHVFIIRDHGCAMLPASGTATTVAAATAATGVPANSRADHRGAS